MAVLGIHLVLNTCSRLTFTAMNWTFGTVLFGVLSGSGGSDILACPQKLLPFPPPLLQPAQAFPRPPGPALRAGTCLHPLYFTPGVPSSLHQLLLGFPSLMAKNFDITSGMLLPQTRSQA